MASVTQRINEIKQPRGGYVRPRDFHVTELQDGLTLSESENIHPSLVGMAVDYLTRFMSGASAQDAFRISLLGAAVIGEQQTAHNFILNIKGLDELSISSACKLVGYDVCFRSNPQAYRDVNSIAPNQDTISNIRIMVNRSLLFITKYGPITKSGFTLAGGYTSTITSGDGDFLTKDTLWDFKVSKKDLLTNQTLQLLTYYLMGIHSIHPEFQKIQRLGVFNPRLNRVYLMNIADISQETIEIVSVGVIGYSKSKVLHTTTPSEEEQDNILYMADIMQYLHCSRYMVMKYFSQQGLPLHKEKNKYYIYESELIAWEKRQERLMLVLILLSLCTFIGCLLFLKIV